MKKHLRGLLHTVALPFGLLVWGCGVPAEVTVDLDGDRDGLTDGEELALGTKPDVVDSDTDGYSDFAEVQSFTDPNEPTDHPYAGDWPIDGCRNDIVSTGNTVGSIAEQFTLQDQHGDSLRLHDFCNKVVLLVGTAFW